MSEIFKFLKNADAERRKLTAEPAESIAVSQSLEFITVADNPQVIETIAEPVRSTNPRPASDPIVAEPGRESEAAIHVETYDFSGADRHIKKVLDPLTIVGEQFRMLRSKLDLMSKQRGIRTVLVTSTVPQEGKTFTACGLAGVFAQEPGRSVVLIDADMRKPKSGRSLGLNGISKTGGLSTVLRGETGFREALLNFANQDFYFLPSGPLPPNPSELLSSATLELTVKLASQSFDWVIIDSPPVLALADASLIAPLCDAVLLVVRANSTPSKLIVDAVQRIGREKICGIVMNRLKHISSSKYYYSYYHEGSKKRNMQRN